VKIRLEGTKQEIDWLVELLAKTYSITKPMKVNTGFWRKLDMENLRFGEKYISLYLPKTLKVGAKSIS
jgi:hypothetical protein